MSENLELKVSLLSDDFIRSTRAMKDGLTDIGKAAKQTQSQLDNIGKKSSKGFGDIGKDARSAASTISGIGKQFGGILGSGAGSAIGGGLSTFQGLLTFDIPTAAQGFASIIVAATQAFIEGVKTAGESLISSERLALGYRLSLGQNKATTALQDINAFSGRTAIGSEENKKAMLPLYKSGFSPEEARTARAAAGDVAAMSGSEISADTLKPTLDFIRMTKVRGGAMRRQLDTVLNNIGASEEDFYKRLGGMIGVSSEAAKKRATKGDLATGNAIRTLFYKMVEERDIAGGVKPDEHGRILAGGEKLAGESLGGMLNKITSLPATYLAKLTESGALPKLESKLGELFSAFDPSNPNNAKQTQGIMTSLDTIFTGIATVIGNTFDTLKDPETVAKIKDFVSGIGNLVTETAKGYGPIIDLKNALVSLIEPIIYISKLINMLSPSKAIYDANGALKDYKDKNGETDVKSLATQALDYYKASAFSIVSPDMGVSKAIQGIQMVVSAARQSSNSTTLNAPVVINITAGKDEDQTHTSQRMASELSDHITRMFEKAKQQAGQQ